jgi:hypothetical protein
MKLHNEPEGSGYSKKEATDKEGGSIIYMQFPHRTMLRITILLFQKHNPQ